MEVRWGLRSVQYDRVQCTTVYTHLRLLQQRRHVAHTQDPTRHALRIKRFQIVHPLAHADELDGLPTHSTHTQGRPAASVTVHFCENGAGDTDVFVKSVGHDSV